MSFHVDNTLTASVDPDDDSPIMVTFPEVTGSKFSFLFPPFASVPEVAVAGIGKAAQITNGLKAGFEQPRNGWDYKTTNNISEMGVFLGRTRRKQAVNFNISTDGVDYDWLVDPWRELRDELLKHPFWFSWSHRYDETVFAWTQGQQSTPSFEDQHWSKWSISAAGAFD